jgi:hypothetical protein
MLPRRVVRRLDGLEPTSRQTKSRFTFLLNRFNSTIKKSNATKKVGTGARFFPILDVRLDSDLRVWPATGRRVNDDLWEALEIMKLEPFSISVYS